MHSNRGMFLEELINNTNRYYERQKIALIEKREVPILITKKDGAKIEGMIKSKSKVDYFGNWNGSHIEFEAKTTSCSTFYASKLSEHQRTFLKNSSSQLGITFIILYFSKYRKFFLVKTFEGNISYAHCLEKEKEIPLKFPGILDYISLLSK